MCWKSQTFPKNPAEFSHFELRGPCRAALAIWRPSWKDRHWTWSDIGQTRHWWYWWIVGSAYLWNILKYQLYGWWTSVNPSYYGCEQKDARVLTDKHMIWYKATSFHGDIAVYHWWWDKNQFMAKQWRYSEPCCGCNGICMHLYIQELTSQNRGDVPIKKGDSTYE
jgi:hypothetical protein